MNMQQFLSKDTTKTYTTLKIVMLKQSIEYIKIWNKKTVKVFVIGFTLVLIIGRGFGEADI